MHTYLLSYDLGGPETSESYKNLISEIRKYGYRAKPLESLWYIKTYDSIDSVASNLTLYLDNNDKLIVMDVTNDVWQSINLSKDVSDWMKNHI